MDRPGTYNELNKSGKMIELLAPAGNRDALHAAVENGADAVYLGGRSFNARENADNFDAEMLREELLYAHARGVSLYLTLNTLVSDDEIKQAVEFAAEARYAGIDGIIVQDLGLAAALRKVMPDVPLHGSTQMTVYDLAGVRTLEDMGFSRAVLARELPLKEISDIAHNTKLEIEVFVHGALCVCYSGQCLMSSMIGGRSGNRGKCAQPCRLPYQLAALPGSRPGGGRSGGDSSGEGSSGGTRINEYRNRTLTERSGYLMSPKDMCTLEFMADIADSGIRSLKIEGRMKSPEYVATVVRLYRKYLDLAIGHKGAGNGPLPGVEENDRHDILQIYNRGGFSTGYMMGKTGADMMSYEKPNNSGIYLGKVQAYDSRTKTVTIRLEWDLHMGDGVEIWTGGTDSPGGTITSITLGKQNAKMAKKGDLAVIGEFKGRIAPGFGVYKTLDITLNKQARETFSGKLVKRVKIAGEAVLQHGRPLILRVWDSGRHSATAKGTMNPEEALNKPLSEERLREQLYRTGSTPFVFTELKIEIASGLTIPVSEINEVRRQALVELYKIRAERYPDRRSLESVNQAIDSDGAARPAGCVGCSLPHITQVRSGQISVGRPALSLYFYKWDKELEYSSLGADRVYLPFNSIGKPGFQNTAKALQAAGTEVFAWLPAITRGNYDKLIERFLSRITGGGHEGGRYSDDGYEDERNPDDGYEDERNPDDAPEAGVGIGPKSLIEGVLCGNIGTIRKFVPSGLRLAGDISLNIFNTDSFTEAAKYGLDSIALSAELTLQQATCIGRALAAVSADNGRHIVAEAAVYGRIPLMISEYCPVGCIEGGYTAGRGCSGACSKEGYSLRDRKGSEFPVLCDRTDCRSIILNSDVLFVPDIVNNLTDSGVGMLRLYIWDEGPERIKELIRLYRAARQEAEDRQAGKRVANMQPGPGYTKGHYFRGV
ncbi:MAG TPA: U32 family peptidase [Clostridia bacterium]|nr:U32 family peptidase [Clostridia bacterium]